MSSLFVPPIPLRQGPSLSLKLAVCLYFLIPPFLHSFPGFLSPGSSILLHPALPTPATSIFRQHSASYLDAVVLNLSTWLCNTYPLSHLLNPYLALCIGLPVIGKPSSLASTVPGCVFPWDKSQPAQLAFLAVLHVVFKISNIDRPCQAIGLDLSPYKPLCRTLGSPFQIAPAA